VTFTNKAAREMKERAMAIIKPGAKRRSGPIPEISTFHSLCVRILRRNATALTAALGGLKGPLMKVAQLLATIPEAVPAEYAEELRHSNAWKADYTGEIQKLVDSWGQTYGNSEGGIRFYRAVGCDKCGKTGYKGRVGLHELLVADDTVKKLIQERARVAELFAASVESGMRTLKMDGMEKIMMGLTDLKMVRSVCIK
jgi:hypothetical protein